MRHGGPSSVFAVARVLGSVRLWHALVVRGAGSLCWLSVRAAALVSCEALAGGVWVSSCPSLSSRFLLRV
eukprot:4794457-Prymnesium_polylepis.1